MTAHPAARSIHITVNGEPREARPVTVRELLVELGVADRRIAVELNQELLPRDRHAGTVLREGDRLEVVSFVGGG